MAELDVEKVMLEHRLRQQQAKIQSMEQLAANSLEILKSTRQLLIKLEPSQAAVDKLATWLDNQVAALTSHKERI